MFDRMIVVTVLIDRDDVLVRDQCTRGSVQSREIGAEGQRRTRDGQQGQLRTLLIRRQAGTTWLAPSRVWRKHTELEHGSCVLRLSRTATFDAGTFSSAGMASGREASQAAYVKQLIEPLVS